jgi:hypothetical protein
MRMMVVEGFNVNPRSKTWCVDEKDLSMKRACGRKKAGPKRARLEVLAT